MIVGITGTYGILGSILTKLLYQYTIIRFNGDIRKTKDITKWLISNHFDTIIYLAAIVAIDQINIDKKITIKLIIVLAEFSVLLLKIKKKVILFQI